MHALLRSLVRSALLGVIVFLSLTAAAWSAENAAVVDARIFDDIEYLASDELEGRGIDTPGITKAANYIRDQFQAIGLKGVLADGGYLQPFQYAIDAKARAADTSLVLEGPAGQRRQLEIGKDFHPLAYGGAGSFDAPVVFVGYGISATKEYKYDDYADIDVKGKVVMILRREPQQDDKESVFDGTSNTIHAGINAKVQNAIGHEVAGILFVSDPFSVKKPADDTLMPVNYIGIQNPVGLPIAHITQATADALLATTPLEGLRNAEALIDEQLKPVSQAMEGWQAKATLAIDRIEANLSNVVGVMEGEGPTADQTVIIGAHYDHLGYGSAGSLARGPNRKEIHNGADDNASGTVALMELARRFTSRNTPPKRRLVFIAFSAEERGLIGSAYYVRKNPLFPLKSTVAMVNFDMVGRLTDNKGLILLGTGTGDGLDALVDRINKHHGLTLSKNPGTSGGFGGSDHMSFYSAKIPVLHFFTGTHKDYHRPGDDVEKVNIEGIRRVADYSEELIDALLEMPEAMQYVRVKQTNPHAGVRARSGRMAYLGTLPDYATQADGMRIDDVQEDSPAEKGGLKAGDIMIDFAGLPIKDVNGLVVALRKHKAGETVDITVMRGKEEKVVKVTLGKK